MTRPTIVLRLLAGLIAVVATGLTVLHLVTPRMAVSDGTLRIARKLLLPVQEQNDFEFLAAQPIWSNQPLRLLLQHMHLANYNRTLVDWKVEDDLYREYVLSPVIAFATSAPSVYPPAALHHPFTPDFDWRRILWEHFIRAFARRAASPRRPRLCSGDCASE